MKFFVPFFVLLPCIVCLGVPNQDPGPDLSNNRNDEPVYMLTYDHGGLVLWGTDHLEERLDNAIAWLDRYPGFKIGLDNEAYVYDFLSENQPDLLQKLQDYLESYRGRFGIGSCTYGQPLSTFIGGESNIRQIGYALEANRKYFNYENKIYLMSEHAMHAQIPQILNGFGFEGAIMRTHYMMYGYNPTYKEPIGWWIGVDGSRIKTVPTYEGEGASFGRTTIDNWILTRYPGSDASFSMTDYRKQFQHINPLLATRADDSDLRKEDLLKEYEGNKSYQWILLDELLALYPEPTVNFKTSPDDFTVRMPWGYCGNEIWNKSRKAEVQVLTTERLAALGYLNTGKNYEEDLDASWKHLLLAQHHDVQIVGLLPDARQHLDISLNESNLVQKKVMEDLFSMLKGGGVQKVIVFNPLSSSKSEWIRSRVRFKRGEAKDVAVYCGNERVPSTVLSADRFSSGYIMEGEIAFKADFENFGLKTYTLHPLTEPERNYSSEIIVDYENLKITTGAYHLDLAEEGGIQTLISKKTGENVFIPGKRNAFLTGIIDGEEYESRGKWVISRVNKEKPWVKATEYGFISDIPYELELKIEENSPLINWKISIKLDSQRIGQLSDNTREINSSFTHEKKLRFKFFPNLDHTTRGIRDLPFVLAETDNKYIQGNYWTALEDGANGMAIFNKGTMCQVREDDGGSSIPLVYAMYYIWGTRMLEGEFNFEFALYPYSGGHQSAEIHKKALSYNFPMIYHSGEPREGSLGPELELFSMGSNPVVLSSLFVDDEKVYIRMFNCMDEPVQCALENVYNEKGLIETDLKGNKIDAIETNISFKPWQFKTFEIAR